LDKVFGFFVFFIIGGLARQYEDIYLQYLDRYRKWLYVLFAGSLALLYFTALLPYSVTKLVVGTLSIPALHALCLSLVNREQSMIKNLLLLLGTYTMVIYLFNTITIGITKGVLFKFISWDGLNFLFFAPTLIMAGLLGPIVLWYIWKILRESRFFPFNIGKNKKTS
jgi:hypothetical protein